MTPETAPQIKTPEQVKIETETIPKIIELFKHLESINPKTDEEIEDFDEKITDTDRLCEEVFQFGIKAKIGLYQDLEQNLRSLNLLNHDEKIVRKLDILHGKITDLEMDR